MAAFYKHQGKNLWAYSLAYNSFVFVDIALVIIAGVLVLKFIKIINKSEQCFDISEHCNIFAEQKQNIYGTNIKHLEKINKLSTN